MSYKLEWFDNNPYASLEGDVTYIEINQVQNKFLSDPRYDHSKYAIINFSKVTSLNITEDQIKIISEFDKGSARWNKEVRLALIAQDKLIKEVLNTYSELMKEFGWNIKIFNKQDKAIEWCKK